MLAAIHAKGAQEQWVYHLGRHGWRPPEMKSSAGEPPKFQHPCGQMVWVGRYGVQVNFCGTTSTMRPELR